MYSIDEYKNLTLKYGSYASWAIWDYENASDTTIIDENNNQLHSRFILLGLNISRLLDKPFWSNFHDNTHARKLKYACNDTKLRGSYITDLFKDTPEPNAVELERLLTDRIINKNVNIFKQEMQDIKISNVSTLIVFGSLTAKCFNKYFKQNYKNQVINCQHYSYRILGDKEWVNGFWKKLDINQNYDSIIKKYK